MALHYNFFSYFPRTLLAEFIDIHIREILLNTHVEEDKTDTRRNEILKDQTSTYFAFSSSRFLTAPLLITFCNYESANGCAGVTSGVTPLLRKDGNSNSFVFSSQRVTFMNYHSAAILFM